MEATLKRKMLRDMMRIRSFEETLYELIQAGEMNGFLHLYLGEEACAVGVCSALNADDYIASTHRGHGHVIAKGVNPREMMAELYGKSTGTNKGKGGSMHICVPELGIIGTNGIVGGGLPLATGAAFSAKYRKNGRVSVCFFGDGASNEGSFHECLNMAAIWNLPVIFVCENNQYACNTPFVRASNTKDVANRARGYNIPSMIADGQDVWQVYEKAREAVAYARNGNGPVLMECKTYRWYEHCVGDPDLRPGEEKAAWKTRDCIRLFADRLAREGVASPEEAQAMWDEARAEIAAAVDYGRQSPEPAPDSIFEDVYAD